MKTQTRLFLYCFKKWSHIITFNAQLSDLRFCFFFIFGFEESSVAEIIF